MRTVAVVCGLMAWSAQLFAAGEFEAWKRESEQQYRGYRDAQDRQFGQYLDQQWREFRVFRGDRRDPTPKPVVVPTRGPSPAAEPAPAPLPIPKPSPAPITPPATLPPATPAPSPAPVPPAVTPGVTIKHFGAELRLPAVAIPPLEGRADATAISKWWQQASEADDGKAVTALGELRDRQHLPDWSLHLLIGNYVAASGGGWNSRVAREWFYLTRLGYLARVAVADGQLALLLKTDHALYETRYLEIAGTRYYLVAVPSSGGDRFTTYQGEHPAATRPVSMAQDFALFGTRTPDLRRRLAFAYQDRNYSLDVNYSAGLMEYLYAIPPTELSVYFNTPESPVLGRQLSSQLRPMLAGLSKEESVNLLLAFVQKAFAYEVDNKQFGREHYMFADETVHYPYSDCEDRAVIFARLVRELVGIPVVGVSYPGHVATAVSLPGAKGRTLTYRGANYVIADPTYIGASVGMEMPQFTGVVPEVVEIR